MTDQTARPSAAVSSPPPDQTALSAVERLSRVHEWVTGEVVTAQTEFGNGYRAAQRDIRDLIKGRFDNDAANELRRLAAEAQQQPDTPATDLRALTRQATAIWGETPTPLPHATTALAVVAGDIARQARNHAEGRPVDTAELGKEYGNLILSTLRWMRDAGLDPDDCVTAALEAQQRYAAKLGDHEAAQQQVDTETPRCPAREPLDDAQCSKRDGHDGPHSDRPGRIWYPAPVEEECCGVEPPTRADDPNSQWGDCWCTLPPGHDGEHRCQPCTDRHGAPGWTDAPAVPVQPAAADTHEETGALCGSLRPVAAPEPPDARGRTAERPTEAHSASTTPRKADATTESEGDN